jgi:hypothetical protein
MRGTLKTLIVVLGLASAVPAAAQSIPRHDLSVLLGWSTANRPRPSLPYDSWIGAWFTTATTGWYWSDHQKTEVTVAGASERQHFGGFEFTEHSPLSYTSSSTTFALRTQLFTGAQIYQFFRNTYVHPFVGAGVEIDRERWETVTVDETYVRASESPISPYELTTSTTTRSEPDVRLRARPFAIAGLKGYLSERTFIRADISLSAGRAFDRVSWRIGGGFDF